MIDLQPRHREAIIIGDGPSQSKMYKKPGFAKNKSVCLVNRPGLRWRHEADYWISFHSMKMREWIRRRECMGLPMENLLPIIFRKQHDMMDLYHYFVNYEMEGIESGGSSSLFAAQILLKIGYEKLHIFGVELSIPKYDCHRQYWRILQGQPVVFYDDDQWFANGDWRDCP